MAIYSASNVLSYPVDFDTSKNMAGIITADGLITMPSTDRVNPVIAVVSPAAGSTLAAQSTTITVSVTDVSPLKRVIIFASYSDGTPAEMVYDGTSFTASYSTSVRGTITGGYNYALNRVSGTYGWRSNPTISVYALDDADPSIGTRNETNFTAFSWVYTADPVVTGGVGGSFNTGFN